ncbi:34853_t:CDS:2, partial [Racocetra persica]
SLADRKYPELMQFYLIDFVTYYYLDQAKVADAGSIYRTTNEEEEEIVRKAFDRAFQDPSDLSESKNSEVNFWNDIEHRMADISHELKKSLTDSEMTERINKYLDGEKVITQEGSVKCMFAFDEARTLVNKKVENETLFYHVRRALNLLPKKARIFTIFTDTHSNISNFSPVAYLDPSKRVAEKG